MFTLHYRSDSGAREWRATSIFEQTSARMGATKAASTAVSVRESRKPSRRRPRIWASAQSPLSRATSAAKTRECSLLRLSSASFLQLLPPSPPPGGEALELLLLPFSISLAAGRKARERAFSLSLCKIHIFIKIPNDYKICVCIYFMREKIPILSGI